MSKTLCLSIESIERAPYEWIFSPNKSAQAQQDSHQESCLSMIPVKEKDDLETKSLNSEFLLPADLKLEHSPIGLESVSITTLEQSVISTKSPLEIEYTTIRKIKSRNSIGSFAELNAAVELPKQRRRSLDGTPHQGKISRALLDSHSHRLNQTTSTFILFT